MSHAPGVNKSCSTGLPLVVRCRRPAAGLRVVPRGLGWLGLAGQVSLSVGGRQLPLAAVHMVAYISGDGGDPHACYPTVPNTSWPGQIPLVSECAMGGAGLHLATSDSRPVIQLPPQHTLYINAHVTPACSGIKREHLFITTKLHPRHHGYWTTLEARCAALWHAALWHAMLWHAALVVM